LRDAFEVGSREAAAAFADPRLYAEKFIPNARHVEVQILADAHGTVVHLGERECSVQRRHQKVLEESPALISASTRESACRAAVNLARALGYVGAGTVEFIYDAATDAAWFIEVNARLQVEHPVTELVTELDIVALQLRVADGEPLPFTQADVKTAGHAVEWRITAESTLENLLPMAGRIERWWAPERPGIRLDTHCFSGYSVPPFYDSLLGKLIAHGKTREEALDRLQAAAEQFEVRGIPTNLDLCLAVLNSDEFRRGGVATDWLASIVNMFQQRELAS
jgi:acetyl-CoA carboxylase biotin carboxylase subunit